MEIVSFLLEKGATVDPTNRNGSTPLFLAALRGHLNVAQMLVNNSANVNAQNNDGFAPIHFAASRGNFQG